MLYRLDCSCGKTLGVSVGQAGQSLTCGCGKSITVPQFRDLRKLPEFEEKVERGAGAKRGRDAGVPNAAAWTPLKIVMFVGVVTALVAFSTAGVMAVATVRISGQWDPVFQNKFDSELIDQFTAEETFGAFVQMQKEGLGPKMPSDAMVNFETVGQLRSAIYKALSIGLIGAVIAAACEVASRKSRRSPV